MDIKNLNSKLSNVRGTLDFENLTSKVDIVGKGLKSLSDTKMLLNKVGNSINGIKSVTESLPEAKLWFILHSNSFDFNFHSVKN